MSIFILNGIRQINIFFQYENKLNLNLYLEDIMGSFFIKKPLGYLIFLIYLLDKSGIFYNYSTKVLPSF